MGQRFSYESECGIDTHMEAIKKALARAMNLNFQFSTNIKCCLKQLYH